MNDPHATLVLNGALNWTEELAAIARFGAPLLAADGGADALARLGLRPTAVIGDLDSVGKDVKRWIGEDRLVLRADQESTDFEKALDYAFEILRVPRLVVLGALGARTDHTIGNLGLVARHARGPDLLLRDSDQEILATSRSLCLTASPGETWSFWTFDPGVRVSIAGVRWPVDDEPLDAGSRPSISNEAVVEEISVCPTGGAVVVCRNFCLREK